MRTDTHPPNLPSWWETTSRRSGDVRGWGSLVRLVRPRRAQQRPQRDQQPPVTRLLVDRLGTVVSMRFPSILAGRTFLSTAVTEHGVSWPMPAGAQIRLWFSPDGRLVAGGGCNSINGTVDMSDGRITLVDGGITEIWCDDEWRMELDRWLSELLSTRPSWLLSGRQLRLSAGDTVIELTDRKVLDPDRPLEGTRWVCSLIMGGPIRSSLDGMHDVFFVFGRGRVTGSDGVAPLSWPAVVSGTTIDFGAGADPVPGELANHVRATLRGVVHYEIEAGELTLTGSDEGRMVGLGLTAASASAPAG